MQSTKFFVDGNLVHVRKLNEATTLDALPPKIYTVRFHADMGYYLEVMKAQLELPPKIYGKTLDRATKCIKTYRDRNTSTGILMTGDKGTGKTLLMSLLANRAVTELGLPVLLIREAYSGTSFTTFIESIGESCLVFDEFGKMYDASNNNDSAVQQSELLSLLDGVDKTKRLIILTENSEVDINEFLLNRPSRVYYHFRYKKLEEESILGYCSDRGVNITSAQDIVGLSRKARVFSFDMLQSIVEEHIRFGTAIEDTIADLNIDLRNVFAPLMMIIKVTDKITKQERQLVSPRIIPQPIDDYQYIRIATKTASNSATLRAAQDDADDEPEEAGDKSEGFYIYSSNLAYDNKGKFVFETNKYTVVAEEVRSDQTNYEAML